MQAVYYMTYVTAIVFMAGETARRGLSYFAVNATTVPFAAHLEAWMRGVTCRPDHPHEDFGSVVLKGVIWVICPTCLIVALRSGAARRPATQSV